MQNNTNELANPMSQKRDIRRPTGQAVARTSRCSRRTLGTYMRLHFSRLRYVKCSVRTSPIRGQSMSSSVWWKTNPHFSWKITPSWTESAALPSNKKFGEAPERASAMVLDAPQAGTRSMSFEQVHVIGEELTAQIASASFSSRMRLRSSSAETQKRIGVYR